MIPHRDCCPLGQFSCCENLLSQQTHICYEPQLGMHSTVRAADKHHLSLCCPQQRVLGPGSASVQGLQSTQWVAVYTPRAHWYVAQAWLVAPIGPLFDDGSQLLSAII